MQMPQRVADQTLIVVAVGERHARDFEVQLVGLVGEHHGVALVGQDLSDEFEGRLMVVLRELPLIFAGVVSGERGLFTCFGVWRCAKST
jgi:hypothetical protein